MHVLRNFNLTAGYEVALMKIIVILFADGTE
jgi:hypothetical protein